MPPSLSLLFLCILLLIHGTQGANKYGPSLDFLIDGYSSGDRKELHLDGFPPTFSVAIPLSNTSTSIPVGRAKVLQGEFGVLAPSGFGIMVVIQSLKLRTTLAYSSPSFSFAEDTTYLRCRDWLKFTAGNQSVQVCGSVGRETKDAVPPHLLGLRTFITSESKLTASLFVDGEIYPSDFAWPEEIEVEIGITAFKKCPKNNWISQLKKLVGSNPWRSCSPSEDIICVHTGTFCDGVRNCGVKGPLGHIGYDEEKCGSWFRSSKDPKPTPRPQQPASGSPSSSNNNNNDGNTAYIGVNKPYTPPSSGAVISPIHVVIIFAVTVLLIFAGCTWLAKANEKRFQHTVYRFSTVRRNRRHRNNREQGHPSRDQGTMNRRPSAPPDSTVGGDMEEGIGEQPPPPYMELFPASAPPLPSTTTGTSSSTFTSL